MTPKEKFTRNKNAIVENDKRIKELQAHNVTLDNENAALITQNPELQKVDVKHGVTVQDHLKAVKDKQDRDNPKHW